MNSKSELEIKRLFRAAKRKREPHEAEMIDAFLYALPQHRFRQDLRDWESPPDRRKLYDTTAGRGVRNLTQWTMRLLLPMTTRFARIKVQEDFEGPNGINADTVAARHKMGIDRANDRLRDHFIDSNFYMATEEALTQCIITGTMCVATLKHGKGVTYQAVPVDEIFFNPSRLGIDDVHRVQNMRGRQILEMQDSQGWDLPNEILESIRENPTKRIKITERIIPNGGRYDHVIWTTGCKVLHKDVMDWKPLTVRRWETIAGQAWGNRPVRQVLPHIKTVNEINKDALVFAAIIAHGVWVVTGQLIDPQELAGRIKPGDMINVPEGVRISQLPMRPNFPINENMMRREQRQIQAGMMDATPPNIGDIQYVKRGVMDFYRRIWERTIRGPALRMQREYLKPIAEQTAGRLLRKLNPIPIDELARLGVTPDPARLDRLFRVDVTAALSRLLSQQEARETLRAWIQGLQAYGENAMARTWDVQKMAQDIPSALGMPRKYRLKEPTELTTEARAQSLASALARFKGQGLQG